MKWNYNYRIGFLGFVIIVVAIITIGRLYFLQIIHGKEYRNRSNNELTNSSEPLFDRGLIYFSTKNKELVVAAAVKEGFTLSLKPSLVQDTEKAYNEISKLLTIDKKIFFEKASKKDDPYEEIQKRVPKEIGEKIKELNIPGVLVIKEQWRIYPSDFLASHILGFVGYNNNVLEGRYGLERYYEDNLNRKNDDTGNNFFVEIFSDVKKIGKGGDNLEANLETTIEPSTQRTLESELKKVTDQWGSKMTGGIIMDPSSGEIYALASYPNFDPNYYGKETDISIFSNPLVEKVYEMGSIIKPITMAIGLDTETVTASTTYKDDGFLKVSDRTIYNFDKKGRGVVNMQEVLNQSLNTGASFVALKLGKKKFLDYVNNFGLNEETGIDLPSEAGSLFKNLQSGGEVELANASFGQGIAITPIAMARALSVLGNGGKLPSPHIVRKFDYKLGFSKNVVITDEEKRQVIKKETSEEITRMLVEVVDKALKGGAIKMKDYSIAAKTGTAQIANKESGGYYSDRFLHSFFGYFPAYNPKFIIFLYTVEPKADYASNTLTTPFINLVKFLIHYYEIPPDR